MSAKYPQRFYRILLRYFPILMLGVLIGFLFGKSHSEPKSTSTEAKNQRFIQSNGSHRLVGSPGDLTTKKEISDRADENVPSHLKVSMGFIKNVGYSGIYFHEGKLRFHGDFAEILGITDEEEAKLGHHFASVLSSVRESQIQGSEVVVHDPDGETIIKVAAPSEELSQRWLDEAYQVCKSVLGDVRGTQFREIASDQVEHSLSYSAMTITVNSSSSPDVPPGEGFFEFIVESEGGISTSNSTSVPFEIAHLVGLTGQP